jgi:hypothetical protein
VQIIVCINLKSIARRAVGPLGSTEAVSCIEMAPEAVIV